MKIRLVLLAAAALLIAPTAASGKGASQARIDGPGLGKAIVIAGNGEGPGTPLGDIADQAGFFPGVFGQSPDPMVAKPDGDLGPKYVITYVMPGPNNEESQIRQDVYPFAKGGPVTYTRPGQTYWDGQKTRGGWFLAGDSLKDSLVSVGLPRTAPTTSDRLNGGWPTVGAAIAVVGALALFTAAAAVAIRRRPRPALR